VTTRFSGALICPRGLRSIQINSCSGRIAGANGPNDLDWGGEAMKREYDAARHVAASPDRLRGMGSRRMKSEVDCMSVMTGPSAVYAPAFVAVMGRCSQSRCHSPGGDNAGDDTFYRCAASFDPPSQRWRSSLWRRSPRRIKSPNRDRNARDCRADLTHFPGTDGAEVSRAASLWRCHIELSQ